MSQSSLVLVVAVDVGEARGEGTWGEVEVAEAEFEVEDRGEARRFWFCRETRKDLGDIILWDVAVDISGGALKGQTREPNWKIPIRQVTGRDNKEAREVRS
ncbi:hypothetical protein VM1G_11303 [Cytospora mali]|uniref:Uncharacterized protein n=1 Tax=Cytospora mali TaxID=578113 RepID=A0A194VM19_CYTMA|nr:hypothetical protein VM1G_11303 [Valsa mali]